MPIVQTVTRSGIGHRRWTQLTPRRTQTHASRQRKLIPSAFGAVCQCSPPEAPSHLIAAGVLVLRHKDLRRLSDLRVVAERKLEGALLRLAPESHAQGSASDFAGVRTDQRGQRPAARMNILRVKLLVWGENTEVLPTQTCG